MRLAQFVPARPRELAAARWSKPASGMTRSTGASAPATASVYDDGHRADPVACHALQHRLDRDREVGAVEGGPPV